MSRPAWSIRGIDVGARPLKTRNSIHAKPHPNSAPPPLNNKLSARLSRSSLARPAPNAARTASSFRRLAERASIRLATFAQTISKMETVAANSTQEASRTSWTWKSRSGRTSTLASFQRACGRFVWMLSSRYGRAESRACGNVTPAFMRPKTRTAPLDCPGM